MLPIDNVMMAIDTSQIKEVAIFSAIRMLRLLRLIKVRGRNHRCATCIFFSLCLLAVRSTDLL